MITFKPLRDLVIFRGGGTPSKQVPEYWDGDIPWASVKDFTSTSLSETQDFITQEGLRNSSANLIPKGHVIIPTRMSLGKAAINSVDLAINQDLRALIPKVPLDANFLLHAVLSLKEEIVKKGSGATVKGITQEELYKFEIHVPEEFGDQIRIAHLLGKVEGLIAQRKQHLQQLDDLLKSMFLKMFGDIRAKKSIHPWVALRPYLKANSGKSSKGVASEINTGIPIYGGNGVNGWAKKALYEGPVVIAGRVGQQCGVIHVSKEPCWVTDNAIVLSISDHSQLNTIYLASAFHYAPIRERVKQLDLPFINQSMLLDYPLPLPPIDLQNKFAAIVERVEALKSHYQQSVTDLEALYGALSQQAFKGELDLSRVALLAAPIEGEKPVVAAVPAPITVPVIELPEADLLLPALQDRAQLAPLLRFWLEAYRTQLGGVAFSLERFIAAAQTRLAELHPDNDFELRASDYEHVKAWVFEALDSGRLRQERNQVYCVIETKETVLGNLIELKASQT